MNMFVDQNNLVYSSSLLSYKHKVKYEHLSLFLFLRALKNHKTHTVALHVYDSLHFFRVVENSSLLKK